MKCQKCGSELRDGAKFCDNCGAAVEIKKLCPNYIKHYDKWCDFREKRVLKKATTDLEKEKIKENTKFLKMEITAAKRLPLYRKLSQTQMWHKALTTI